jgi:acyl-CoA reductase-like NAD-dependent aldehyde dehydrogenase
MSSYAMLINGRSVTTPEQDDVINPARGEPFATCPRGSRAHVDEAVAAAANAYKTWKKDEAFRRAKLTDAAYPGRAQEIATCSAGAGQPLTAAVTETFGASMAVRLLREPEARASARDTTEAHQVVRKPLGVVAAITPWNQ